MFQRFSLSKSSRVLFSALLLTSASVTFAAPAKDAPATREKHFDAMISKLEKELNLTPGQTAQVREILRPDSSLHPWMQGEEHGKRGEHGGPGMPPFLGEEFLDQLRADQVDTVALNKRFADRQAMMEQHHRMMMFKFIQLHDVLTPAQRAKMAEMIEKRRDEAMQHRRGK